MKLHSNFLLLITLLRSVVSESFCENGNCTDRVENETSKVLSRRKRYLIFPDGSSFQLVEVDMQYISFSRASIAGQRGDTLAVFCVQTSALIPIGDIFLYSNTAALAWALPSDPKFFFNITEFAKAVNRRNDAPTVINYLDERGRIIAKVPYKRKKIINPAIAKRSVDGRITYKEKLKIKIDRMRMHGKQLNRDYLKTEHMNRASIEFHRSSRVGLFEKLEKLFTTLGQDGRQCVLYKLCEAAQAAPQGTFLQEFLRIVFTLPKGKEFEREEHKDYDKAHTPSDDCAASYPDCEHLQIHLY